MRKVSNTRLNYKKVLNTELNYKIVDGLESLLKKIDHPRSLYVRDVISQYLEDYENACIALNRLNKKKARYITMEEVEKKIGL